MWKEFKYIPDKTSFKDQETDSTGDIESKDIGKKKLKESKKILREVQDKLYAHDKYAVLIVFQAMDAAGKDSTIKHVMSGVNPQGCYVKSFKKPSSEELDHDFLWRCYKELPERGMIGIFNRSYYEEVLITKVHPDVLNYQKLPGFDIKNINKDFWNSRYDDINNFEKHLVENGTIVLKFFLNVSQKEQKKRFLDRINNPAKNWKFTLNDLNERQYWEKYMDAYKDILNKTSTDYAPWYVIPADHKWFMRMVVCDIIIDQMKSLSLEYPEVDEKQKEELIKAKDILESED